MCIAKFKIKKKKKKLLHYLNSLTKFLFSSNQGYGNHSTKKDECYMRLTYHIYLLLYLQNNVKSLNKDFKVTLPPLTTPQRRQTQLEANALQIYL